MPTPIPPACPGCGHPILSAAGCMRCGPATVVRTYPPPPTPGDTPDPDSIISRMGVSLISSDPAGRIAGMPTRPDRSAYTRLADYTAALEAYADLLDAQIDAGRVPSGMRASQHAGARLRAARGVAGMSQEEAGERRGVKKGAWSAMEAKTGQIDKLHAASEAIGAELVIIIRAAPDERV